MHPTGAGTAAMVWQLFLPVSVLRLVSLVASLLSSSYLPSCTFASRLLIPHFAEVYACKF